MSRNLLLRSTISTDSMEEDEDAIIDEMPVFLSKNLQDNLYLFQYPTKTMSNFDNAEVSNCCVKPLNQEVKVDFALNIDSQFYDHFKGEQFALAADGKAGATSTSHANSAKAERPTYKRGIMDRQSFVSSHSLDNVSKYIVGIYSDKEIHLSPLTSILQLRPSFTHFDKEDKRTRAEEKALNDGDEEEELQQVTVKFARAGAVAGKKVKERQGYDTYVRKSTDEPWCETYWHARTSPTAELERQKMFATNHRPSQALAMTAQRYIEKLLPSDGQDRGIDAVLPARVISKARLRYMALSDQLKVVLKDAKMLSFDEIVNFLQCNVDDSITSDKVLRTLPQVGVLVRGNWVPQSELLYPAETLSNANGVCSELMIRARDYILFKFSRIPFLYRRQVISTTQLPPEEASEVLQTVARLNTEKKWELILPANREFEERHPELVQRQDLIWRATEQTYEALEFEKSPKRARKKSIRSESKTSLSIMPSSEANVTTTA